MPLRYDSLRSARKHRSVLLFATKHVTCFEEIERALFSPFLSLRARALSHLLACKLSDPNVRRGELRGGRKKMKTNEEY